MHPSATTSFVPEPVKASERIQIIDVLRGFALFGILIVNMEMFSQPAQLYVLPVSAEMPQIDIAAKGLVRLLAEGKFYSPLLVAVWPGAGAADGADREPWRAFRSVIHAAAGRAGLHRPGAHLPDLDRRYPAAVCLSGVHCSPTVSKKAPSNPADPELILPLVPLLFLGSATALIELGRSTPDGAAMIDGVLAQQRAGSWPASSALLPCTPAGAISM